MLILYTNKADKFAGNLALASGRNSGNLFSGASCELPLCNMDDPMDHQSDPCRGHPSSASVASASGSASINARPLKRQNSFTVDERMTISYLPVHVQEQMIVPSKTETGELLLQPWMI